MGFPVNRVEQDLGSGEVVATPGVCGFKFRAKTSVRKQLNEHNFSTAVPCYTLLTSCLLNFL